MAAVVLPDSSMKLPDSLRVIEEEAFVGTKAVYVIVPDGATTICERAFADSESLVFIRIPSSVTSIAENAFSGTEVTIYCDSVDSEAFNYALAHDMKRVIAD